MQRSSQYSSQYSSRSPFKPRRRVRSIVWIAALTVAGSAAVTFIAIDFSKTLQRETALGAAQVYSKTVTTIRDQYTQTFTAAAAGDSDALTHPSLNGVPAAYTILSNVSEDLGDVGPSRFRIFSEHPWPGRENGGPHSAIEHEALRRLVHDGEPSFSKESEVDGVPVISFAEPIVMKKSCVSCHNSHPQSPHTGWKEGDIRGVQLVELQLPAAPLLPTAASANSVLTVALFGSIALAICCLLVWRNRQMVAQADRQTALQEIAQSIGDGLVSIDQHGAITSFNSAAERLFGYQASEVIGQSSTILMSDENALQHVPGFQNFFNNKSRHGNPSNYPLETTAVSKSGEEIPVSMVVALLSDENEPRVIGTIRDLRPSKNLEARLRASQRLEDVGRLTAGVAHDFNNLLMVIGGSAGLLNETEQSPESKELLSDISKTVKNASDLTRQLLALAGRHKPAPSRLDLGEALTETVRLLQRTLHPRIMISVRQDDNLWDVHADASLLESSFVNIAFNSRDAMPNGGKIEIRAWNASIDRTATNSGELCSGDYVAVSFRDDGAGIPPDTIERVFDPFYSTKPAGAGRGLGLSMIREFIRQTGGEVTIESNEGEGTQLTLFIPRSGAEGISRDQEHSPAVKLDRIKILLVDDDSLVRRTVRLMIERAGMLCRDVSNADAALRLMDQESFEVILTDVMMPGHSGPTLARSVQKAYPKTAILLLSGMIDSGAPEFEGVDDLPILRKPISSTDLLAAISDAIATKQLST